MTPTPNDYRSIAALCDRVNSGAQHETISVHAMRHYVRFGRSNGLEKHVRRIGRKILISESGFYEWLHEQKSTRSAA